MIDFDDLDIEETPGQFCDIPDKDFKDFLTSHNAYDKFIVNLINNKKDVISYFESYKGKKILYLSRPFKWCSTPEGEDFWSNLDSIWSSNWESTHDYWSDINKIWKRFLKKIKGD